MVQTQCHSLCTLKSTIKIRLDLAKYSPLTYSLNIKLTNNNRAENFLHFTRNEWIYLLADIFTFQVIYKQLRISRSPREISRNKSCATGAINVYVLNSKLINNQTIDSIPRYFLITLYKSVRHSWSMLIDYSWTGLCHFGTSLKKKEKSSLDDSVVKYV